MSNRCRFDVHITSILRRPNFDKFPRHFHVLVRCNFADWKIHIVSPYFFRRSFTGQNFHVFTLYFFGCNFNGQKSALFPLIFFDVILMVKKSMLFGRTFFDEILMGKNLTSFLVKFQVNENI